MSLVVAPGDLFSLRFQYSNVATPVAYNILHFRLGSLSGGNPSITDFLTAFAGQSLVSWADAWAPSASSQVTLVNARATSVFPLPRSVGVTATETTPRPGDITGEALPLQDSVTILKRTAVGNRWGLGRLFYVGIPEEQQSNGIISNAMRITLGSAVAWVAGNRTITIGPVTAVLNPCLVRGPEDNPVSITNVVTAQLSNTIIKTQRRRRPGKGI